MQFMNGEKKLDAEEVVPTALYPSRMISMVDLESPNQLSICSPEFQFKIKYMDKYKRFKFPNELGDELFYYYLKEFDVFPRSIGLEKIKSIFTAMCEDYLDGNISPERLSEMAGSLVFSELADGVPDNEPFTGLIEEIADTNTSQDGGPLVINKELTNQLVKQFLSEK